MKKATPTRLPDRKKTGRLHQELPLHLMLLPGLVIILIYNYAPMFGLLMAFENYKPTKGIFGSAWVGLENFRRFFAYPDALRVIYNTVFIAVFKLVLGILVPVLFALLVNEIKNKIFSGYVQLVTCLPYFLSWVILGGIFTNILSPSNGLVNEIIRFFGGEPVYFLGENSTFPWTLIITDTWKNFGYSSIIYLAAMSSIDPALYESARLDGANRWQTLWKVTIPNVMPSITICTFLTLTNSFKLFDQNLALTGGQPYTILSDGSSIKETEMLALNILNTFYGQNANSRGTAQAKAVLFFILVATIGLLQLSANRKKEVQQ